MLPLGNTRSISKDSSFPIAPNRALGWSRHWYKLNLALHGEHHVWRFSYVLDWPGAVSHLHHLPRLVLCSGSQMFTKYLGISNILTLITRRCGDEIWEPGCYSIFTWPPKNCFVAIGILISPEEAFANRVARRPEQRKLMVSPPHLVARKKFFLLHGLRCCDAIVNSCKNTLNILMLLFVMIIIAVSQ